MTRDHNLSMGYANTRWHQEIVKLLWPHIKEFLICGTAGALGAATFGASVLSLGHLVAKCLGFGAALVGERAISLLTAAGAAVGATAAPTIVLVGGCVVVGVMVAGRVHAWRSNKPVLQALTEVVEDNQRRPKTKAEKQAWNAELRKFHDVIANAHIEEDSDEE